MVDVLQVTTYADNLKNRGFFIIKKKGGICLYPKG